MPRGYRIIIGATVGWLIVLQGQHPCVAQPTAAHHKESGKNPARRPIGQLPSPKEYKPDCASPKSREESDLCAQWGAVIASRRANQIAIDANRAARDANTVSAETLIWTRYGFGAVVATLIATAWAAWAALIAAGAAHKSIDLYMAGENARLVPRLRPNGRAWALDICNFGKSQAIIFRFDVAASIEPPPEQIPFFLTALGWMDMVVPPDKHVTFPRPIAIPPDGQGFYVYGGAIFRNVFGSFDFMAVSLEIDANGAVNSYQPARFDLWKTEVEKLTKKAKRP